MHLSIIDTHTPKKCAKLWLIGPCGFSPTHGTTFWSALRTSRWPLWHTSPTRDGPRCSAECAKTRAALERLRRRRGRRAGFIPNLRRGHWLAETKPVHMPIHELFPAGTWPDATVWPPEPIGRAPISGMLTAFADSQCSFVGSFFEATLWGPSGERGMYIVGRLRPSRVRDILWYRGGVPPWNADCISIELAQALQNEPAVDHARSERFAAEMRERSVKFTRWLCPALVGPNLGQHSVRSALMAFELRSAR